MVSDWCSQIWKTSKISLQTKIQHKLQAEQINQSTEDQVVEYDS